MVKQRAERSHNQQHPNQPIHHPRTIAPKKAHKKLRAHVVRGSWGAWEEKRVLEEELRKRLEGSEGKSGVPKGVMKVLRGLGGGEGS